MMISRAKAGFVMIAISIFLFLIAGSLDNPEIEMGVAGTAFLGNCLSIAALVLIGLGIYLYRINCPVCGDPTSRAPTHRHYRGHNFDIAPRAHRWNWVHAFNVKTLCARLAQLIVDLFVLTTVATVLIGMLFVAVWMRLQLDVRQARKEQVHPTPVLSPSEAPKLIQSPEKSRAESRLIRLNLLGTRRVHSAKSRL